MRDLQLAIRTLRRSPLFVLTATLTLGVGIGLMTTVLSMLDAVRRPYVPYREPERLFTVAAYGGGTSGQIGPYEKHWALIEGSTAFDGVVTVARTSRPIGTFDYVADQAVVNHVTPEYFDLLGLRLERGRAFDVGTAAAQETEAIIAYRLWQRAFNSRPLSDGLSVTIGQQSYDVIGVMPPEVRPFDGSVWLRLTGTQQAQGTPIVRLRPDVSVEAAYAQMRVVAARLTATYGPGRQPFQFRLDPFTRPPGELADYHWAMGGAAVFILLIACANLANLMLARGLARRKELALRLALGGGRSHLVRHLLAEGVLIALIGGALGAALAVWGVETLRAQLPSRGVILGALVPHLSWRVVMGALAATLASVLVFALGPALVASDVNVSEPLKEGGGQVTGRTRRWHAALPVAEIALCLTLLMGAGLLLRAADRVAAFDFGYRNQGLLATMVRIVPRTVPADSAVPAAFRNVLDRLGRVPGAVRVATTWSPQTLGGALTSDLEGVEPLFVNSFKYRSVSWEFLQVLGVPVIAGRDFEPGDEQGTAPVAIVGEETAAALWPGTSPVGRMIKLGSADRPAEWVRVVGVAKQASLSFRDDPHLPEYPVVFVVGPHDYGQLARLREVVVRVEGNEATVASDLRRELQAAAPGNYIGGFRAWMAAWESQRDTRQFLAGVFGTFALLALGLAAVGLFGVLSYSVGQRMREFGVRVALGARPGDLSRLVIRDASVVILGGTAVGAWLAMSGSVLLDYWLFDIPPTDVISLVAAELILVAVAFAACLSPAVRAARSDPLVILRAT